MAPVKSGQDGQYRMHVDKRYHEMAAFRHIARIVYPQFAVACIIRAILAYAPSKIAPDRDTATADVVFKLAIAGGVVAYFFAGLGTKREQAANVMTFHMLNLVALICHFLGRARVYLTPPERQPDPPEAQLLALSAISVFPQLEDHAQRLLAVCTYLIPGVDAAVMLVGMPLLGVMHLYIMAKKLSMREAEKRAGKTE